MTSGELLCAHLQKVLPEYMVPSAFVMLDRLPLTASGKLDRKALPPPESAARVIRPYDAPRGEVEESIAGIWKQLLRVERPGREDNFFNLGGHSLLATKLKVRIRSAFTVDLPISMVFESPTIRGLASRVEEIRRKNLAGRLLQGGNELDELIESIGAMSDSKVEELMRTLTTGAGS
jgi:hypothetical protein